MTADELSEKSGFDVFVPDMFNGEPIPSQLLKNFPEKPGDKSSIGAKVRHKTDIYLMKLILFFT